MSKLAIDPGITTGLAWKFDSGKYITATAHSAFEVWTEIDPKLIDTVIIERYHGRLISGYGLETVRVIGGVIALCHRFEIPLVQQPPQIRKAFIEPARVYLKANKGETFVVHEVDALAHLLTYEEVQRNAKRAELRQAEDGGWSSPTRRSRRKA